MNTLAGCGIRSKINGKTILNAVIMLGYRVVLTMSDVTSCKVAVEVLDIGVSIVHLVVS